MSETKSQEGLDFKALQAVRRPEAVEDAAGKKSDAEAHKEFHDKFQAGQCSFCNEALSSFDAAKPCRHWLLKPAGVEKKDIELLGIKYGWGTLENYLRWVANEGAFARNINDLADEASGKLIEITMKYDSLQWSFSCGSNDLDGHETNSDASKKPHYHFQMYVDNKPFVRYNDYHLPLTAADAEYLSLMRQNPRIKRANVAGGAGTTDLLKDKSVEELAALGRSAQTEEEVKDGAVGLTTIVEKKGMPVEDVMNAIRGALARGESATSGLLKLNAPMKTIGAAGPGVVRQAARREGTRAGDSARNEVAPKEVEQWKELFHMGAAVSYAAGVGWGWL
jgi:hypothetical protein